MLVGLGVLGYGVYATNSGKLKPGPGGTGHYGGGTTKQTTSERYEYYHDKNGNLMKKTTTWYIRK